MTALTWYVARSAGIVAYLLMSTSVVLGGFVGLVFAGCCEQLLIAVECQLDAVGDV